MEGDWLRVFLFNIFFIERKQLLNWVVFIVKEVYLGTGLEKFNRSNLCLRFAIQHNSYKDIEYFRKLFRKLGTI